MRQEILTSRQVLTRLNRWSERRVKLVSQYFGDIEDYHTFEIVETGYRFTAPLFQVLQKNLLQRTHPNKMSQMEALAYVYQKTDRRYKMVSKFEGNKRWIRLEKIDTGEIRNGIFYNLLKKIEQEIKDEQTEQSSYEVDREKFIANLNQFGFELASRFISLNHEHLVIDKNTKERLVLRYQDLFN